MNPDPFQYLAGKIALDAWTTAMLALWQSGLWLMRLVLRIVDALLVPDLTGDGPGGAAYQTTFWLAGTLLIILVLVQVGVAVLRRDGASLATAVLGTAKFVIVWVGWVGYAVLIVAAAGGLSRALMRSLLRVDRWASWQPFADYTVKDIADAAIATVLGLLGLLLWLAAIGHLMVMLARAGALIVLAAVTPIAAAGLAGVAGRAWFWTSLRWFHAAAFTPPLMILTLGVGIQFTTGAVAGHTDTTTATIGTALPGALLILVACAAPLALFKLLAFIDPSTGTGAALRQAWGDYRGAPTGGGSSSPAGASRGVAVRTGRGGGRWVGGGGGGGADHRRPGQRRAGRPARPGPARSPPPPGPAWAC